MTWIEWLLLASMGCLCLGMIPRQRYLTRKTYQAGYDDGFYQGDQKGHECAKTDLASMRQQISSLSRPGPEVSLGRNPGETGHWTKEIRDGVETPWVRLDD